MIVAETSLGRMTKKKPGKRISKLRKIKMDFLWRLDQRYYPYFDRPILLRDRRLGHQISGRLFWRTSSGPRF